MWGGSERTDLGLGVCGHLSHRTDHILPPKIRFRDIHKPMGGGGHPPISQVGCGRPGKGAYGLLMNCSKERKQVSHQMIFLKSGLNAKPPTEK